jgi:hypothetical protein
LMTRLAQAKHPEPRLQRKPARQIVVIEIRAIDVIGHCHAAAPTALRKAPYSRM